MNNHKTFKLIGLLAFLAGAAFLLGGSVLLVAKAFASNSAWHEVRAERQAYWDGRVENAPKSQQGTMLFIRSKVERKVCVGGRDLEWSRLGLEQTRAGILKRERDCLAVLREEVMISRQEEKVAMIDEVARTL